MGGVSATRTEVSVITVKANLHYPLLVTEEKMEGARGTGIIDSFSVPGSESRIGLLKLGNVFVSTERRAACYTRRRSEWQIQRSKFKQLMSIF